jgi:hypothetical protein
LKGFENVSYKCNLMLNDSSAHVVPATRKTMACKIPLQISLHDFTQGKGARSAGQQTAFSMKEPEFIFSLDKPQRSQLAAVR